MEQYINTKVCYYKIFTTDTCILLSNYLTLLDLEQQYQTFQTVTIMVLYWLTTLDDIPTNDNELHQVICNNFKIDYF